MWCWKVLLERVCYNIIVFRNGKIPAKQLLVSNIITRLVGLARVALQSISMISVLTLMYNFFLFPIQVNLPQFFAVHWLGNATTPIALVKRSKSFTAVAPTRK